jgi:hypothetical protein
VLVTYLRRCLHKDRKQRIGDVQSVRLALEGTFETAEPIRSSSRTARLWPWSVGLALAILLLLAILRPWTPTSAVPPPMRLDVRLGAGEQLVVDENEDGPLAVLSPDGRTLVYRATRDSVRRLYVRAARLARIEAALWHRGSAIPLLLSGRPVDRVLRWRPAQEGRGSRRVAACSPRCSRNRPRRPRMSSCCRSRTGS